jgi:maltose O-acetyltransferase
MRLPKRFIVNTIASNHLLPSSLRLKLYRLMGLKINAKEIRARCFISSEFIKIGKGSFINTYCQFHSSYVPKGYIELGENCYVGMNVNFCTITHEMGDKKQRAGKDTNLPINVGDGVWIGANSTILPGVTIEEGCVIAAGSVVNTDCKSDGLYAGTPAKRIKDLD